MSELTAEQLARYKRHLLLPDVGPEGQGRLLASRVLLVGAGGLGSPAALYLAAAGVGAIGLVDFDAVDVSNLQRQVLYRTSDVGRPKLAAAAEQIAALNPDVKVELHGEKLSSANAQRILGGYDVVLDGTDTFASRYLTSDVCTWLGTPLVYGSVMRFEGQVSVFDARRGPCYRCLFPEPPPPELAPNCAEAGVLGVLPGVIGLLQATEVLKLLLGVGEPLVGVLLTYDALAMEFRRFRIERDPACAVCGEKPTIHAPMDYEAFCAASAAPPGERQIPEMPPDVLRARMTAGESLLLLDVREPFEADIARIEGSRLVPLGTLDRAVVQLEPYRDRTIVVYCHRGGRSRKACEILLARGFDRVENLSGGIDSWAEKVDPSLDRY